MVWYHNLMALAGQNPTVVFVIVGFFMLRRLPWLIAAFRVAIAQGDDDEAKRARKALDAIEPHVRWIWQKRG